jgi:quinol monooxygenase YgiN
MPVLFTAIITTNDWKVLREQNHATLVVQAQQAGAIRYHIYRNIHDASQVLMIAEFPDDDALHELRQALYEQIGALAAGGRSDERTWEPTGWESIG